LLVDGHVVGFTEYEAHDGVLVFTHTVITELRRGRGLGTILARGALDNVRRRGLTIVPRCPFVAHVVAEHPDYADLVATTEQ
jgi:hypothetical protein